MHHFRKTKKGYNVRRNNTKSCPFCNTKRFKDAIYEDEWFYIVYNATKYDLFEGINVTEHLLVIPKRHITSFKDMNSSEKTRIVEIMGDYENGDYNVYARSDSNLNRSVKHHHVHLIKTGTIKSKALFYLKKPYFLIKL